MQIPTKSFQMWSKIIRRITIIWIVFNELPFVVRPWHTYEFVPYQALHRLQLPSSFMLVHACACMCVCAYEYLWCMYEHVWMYISICAYAYVCMYVCMCVCIWMWIYACMYVHVFQLSHSSHITCTPKLPNSFMLLCGSILVVAW